MEAEKNNEELKDNSSQEPRVQESRVDNSRMVTHTPIIITDGSASIEFEDIYTEVSPGEFWGDELFIDRVELVDKNPPNDHTSICSGIPSGDFKITVQCAGKDFEVRVEGEKVKIRFDPVEYKPDPPSSSFRRKFKSSGKKIMGIKIQNLAGTVLYHQCRLVPANGRSRVTIVDDHLDEYHERASKANRS